MTTSAPTRSSASGTQTQAPTGPSTSKLTSRLTEKAGRAGAVTLSWLRRTGISGSLTNLWRLLTITWIKIKTNAKVNALLALASALTMGVAGNELLRSGAGIPAYMAVFAAFLVYGLYCFRMGRTYND